MTQTLLLEHIFVFFRQIECIYRLNAARIFEEKRKKLTEIFKNFTKGNSQLYASSNTVLLGLSRG
jgi:hypothetical protein